MLFPNPERIVFTNNQDLIDYVDKGFPPTKKNYDKFMDAVRHPMTDEEVANCPMDKVPISGRLFLDVSEEQMDHILEQIYQNNCRHRNTTIAAFVMGLGIGLMLKK